MSGARLPWLLATLLLAMSGCGASDSGSAESAKASFERLLAGSDSDLFWGVITRIQDHTWNPRNLLDLPPAEQTVIRIARFSGFFGNGGLKFWFEQDGESLGKATVGALREIGLQQSASALEHAYSIFSSAAEWQDWNQRMAAIRTHEGVIAASEVTLWAEFRELEGAAGRYIRSHRNAFDRLRSRHPYDPVSKSYQK